MIAHKEEIFSRPKRTWFVTEKEKKLVAKAAKVSLSYMNVWVGFYCQYLKSKWTIMSVAVKISYRFFSGLLCGVSPTFTA